MAHPQPFFLRLHHGLQKITLCPIVVNFLTTNQKISLFSLPPLGVVSTTPSYHSLNSETESSSSHLQWHTHNHFSSLFSIASNFTQWPLWSKKTFVHSCQFVNSWLIFFTTELKTLHVFWNTFVVIFSYAITATIPPRQMVSIKILRWV